jgi:hypothetical protein
MPNVSTFYLAQNTTRAAVRAEKARLFQAPAMTLRRMSDPQITFEQDGARATTSSANPTAGAKRHSRKAARSYRKSSGKKPIAAGRSSANAIYASSDKKIDSSVHRSLIQ